MGMLSTVIQMGLLRDRSHTRSIFEGLLHLIQFFLFVFELRLQFLNLRSGYIVSTVVCFFLSIRTQSCTYLFILTKILKRLRVSKLGSEWPAIGLFEFSLKFLQICVISGAFWVYCNISIRMASLLWILTSVQNFRFVKCVSALPRLLSDLRTGLLD